MMTAFYIALGVWIVAVVVGFFGRNARSAIPLATASVLWFIGLGFYLAGVLA